MGDPIPITIVTGFLGSGKTTLLLNLVPQLRAVNPSYRMALIKNEFGDVAIDSQLAQASAVSGVSELLNGCICCNLVGQLSTALTELRGALHPDRIVIETSGSAFPATLAMEVNRIARQTGQFSLDGVVTVIDVENWAGYEDSSVTAGIQARYTDLLVYNKWENCDERRMDEVRDRVGDLGVDVAWVKSYKGRVSADLVFGIDGGLARTLTEDSLLVPSGHEYDGHEHHQTEVEVLSVTLSGPEDAAVDPGKLMTLLKTAPRDEVYRIKSVLTTTAGVLNSDGEALPVPPTPAQQRYILNWAFGRWVFTALDSGAAEHGSSKGVALRMTLILAPYESNKWKKTLEAGGLLALSGGERGDLEVTKVV
ncbi:CobW/HypB/UreG, nucleotide-binding domain-containing protein [Xylariaceae sp. FL1272]|nr:CobW/HypB/UreG, nucleotide-binding domain-containing protein [Xylariaceae sp. FL1272]